MTIQAIFAKAALAAAVGGVAFTGLSTPAAAQGYYDGGGYSYDGCQREQTNRGVAGALIGGALGAVIGSQAASRGVRTEGSLLGGAVGAVGGAAVGSSSAACQRGYAQPRTAYYGDRYGDRDGYAQGYAPGRYDYGYAYDHYQPARDSYSRDYYPQNRQVGDGCTLAESPIYLPDGGVQKRFVRVCEDSRGRYQVVD